MHAKFGESQLLLRVSVELRGLVQPTREEGKQIVGRRSERKRNLDTKAVIDQEAFNRMKIKKHEKERKRRKRVLEEKKMVKPGSQAKQKKFNSVEKL